jgi:hypothetical protein
MTTDIRPGPGSKAIHHRFRSAEFDEVFRIKCLLLTQSILFATFLKTHLISLQHASRSNFISHVFANIYKCLILLSNHISVDRTNTRHKQLQALPTTQRKSKAPNTYIPAPTRICTRSKSPPQPPPTPQTLHRLVVNSLRCAASPKARYVQSRAHRQVSQHGVWVKRTRRNGTTVKAGGSNVEGEA